MHAFARAALFFCALACASTSAFARQQPSLVSGRLTLDGKPVAGVDVILFTDGDARRAEVARSSTDADGRFRLSVERPGRFRLLPSAPAYVPANPESAARVITLAPGDGVSNADFSLVRGGVITGQITAPNGRPAIAERRRA